MRKYVGMLVLGLMILVSSIQALPPSCRAQSSECMFYIEQDECIYSTDCVSGYCTAGTGNCCHFQHGHCVDSEYFYGYLRDCNIYCNW